jgi:hypothetical protein
MPFAQLALKLGGRIHRGIDLASESLLGGSQRGDDFAQGHAADNEHVDIAVAALVPARQRAM